MITHRRFLVVVLLAGMTFSPSTVEAGPLFDWLFQRNRSQTIGGANGQQAGLVGQPGGRSCCLGNLFGGNRNGTFASAANPNAPANAYAAAAPNVYGQTAGYAPQTGCAGGWCQQTVVRWIPQTAFRTAYQQVPVTTYKTSTTINPANGLPLTCTRPCTSYTTQARRVPYTTYRPIYTTVPVSDPLASQRPVALGQPIAGTGGLAPMPSTANYGNWSNVPGYTSGNAANLPPALAPRPWPNTGTAGSGIAGNGTRSAPSPWQSVAPPSNSYARNGTPWQSSAGGPSSASSAPGPTDWRPVGPHGATQGPSSGTGRAADDVPRLNRPVYPDEFNDGGSVQEEPPMPDYLRDRISGGSQSQLVPRQGADSAHRNGRSGTGYVNERDPYGREIFGRTGNQDTYRADRPVDDLYSRRQDDGYARSVSPPDLTAPSNQTAPQSSQPRPIRGIPNRRAPDRPDSDVQSNDRTADQRAPAGNRPIIEETSQTRYAATPIEWNRRDSRDQDDFRFDWRKQASRPQRPALPNSAWTPVR